MKIIFAVISFLFLLCFLLSSETFAQEDTRRQNEQNSEQILKEILSEIKQLRLVISKTNVNQLRFQITFDQYKTQQARLDSMNKEMESIKNQLANINQFRLDNEEVIRTSEERAQQATDPQVRQNLERQTQDFKKTLETNNQREKRIKEVQTTLEVQIQVEQAKLDQLNVEMERIKQDINLLLN